MHGHICVWQFDVVLLFVIFFASLYDVFVLNVGYVLDA